MRGTDVGRRRPSLRELTPIDEEWRTLAACAGADPEAWFPAADNNNHGEYILAKSICATCPLRVPCAEYAIENLEAHGCWGGLTPRERQKIRVDRGMPPIPGVAAA